MRRPIKLLKEVLHDLSMPGLATEYPTMTGPIQNARATLREEWLTRRPARRAGRLRLIPAYDDMAPRSGRDLRRLAKESACPSLSSLPSCPCPSTAPR
jgi:hypothetical protein